MVRGNPEEWITRQVRPAQSICAFLGGFQIVAFLEVGRIQLHRPSAFPEKPRHVGQGRLWRPASGVKRFQSQGRKGARLMVARLPQVCKSMMRATRRIWRIAKLYGHGSKKRCQNGTLVSGNMDQNLRNPSSLILSHCHIHPATGANIRAFSGESSPPPTPSQSKQLIGPNPPPADEKYASRWKLNRAARRRGIGARRRARLADR